MDQPPGPSLSERLSLRKRLSLFRDILASMLFECRISVANKVRRLITYSPVDRQPASTELQLHQNFMVISTVAKTNVGEAKCCLDQESVVCLVKPTWHVEEVCTVGAGRISATTLRRTYNMLHCRDYKLPVGISTRHRETKFMLTEHENQHDLNLSVRIAIFQPESRTYHRDPPQSLPQTNRLQIVTYLAASISTFDAMRVNAAKTKECARRYSHTINRVTHSSATTLSMPQCPSLSAESPSADNLKLRTPRSSPHTSTRYRSTATLVDGCAVRAFLLCAKFIDCQKLVRVQTKTWYLCQFRHDLTLFIYLETRLRSVLKLTFRSSLLKVPRLGSGVCNMGSKLSQLYLGYIEASTTP
jgi:hypothetical protein